MANPSTIFEKPNKFKTRPTKQFFNVMAILKIGKAYLCAITPRLYGIPTIKRRIKHHTFGNFHAIADKFAIAVN